MNTPDGNADGYIHSLIQAVIDGQTSSARELTRQALDAGVDAVTIFNDALIPAMNEVGRLMETNEYYIPEVLVSAKATKAAAEVLEPLLTTGADTTKIGTVVIGTVQGDMHDIGKNLVALMLEGSGFRVVDLGVDVSPDAFVQAVKENKADVVALSALLTTTMLNMREVVRSIQESGLRDRVKILIGGAPVGQGFATEIAADGYAPNAAAAANMAADLMRG